MTVRRTRTSMLIVVSLLVAFVGWSVLLFSWPAMRALDERLVAPPLDPMSNQAQIAAAFALLTWPGLSTRRWSASPSGRTIGDSGRSPSRCC